MTAISSSDIVSKREDNMDLRLRRAIVRAERADALTQDQIDCAELALAAGLRDQAAALYAVVFLELGFSEARIERQRDLSSRTGLWADSALPPVPAPARGFSVDLAVSELRSLLAYGPSLTSDRHSYGSWLPTDRSGPIRLTRVQEDDPARLAARTLPLLVALPSTAGDAFTTILGELSGELRAVPVFHVADYVNRVPEDLAAILALVRARTFFVQNQDLLEGLNVPPIFIERAAQLHPNALGPYFSNVPMLLRDVRDIFALIEAARAGIPKAAEQECWAVLLSSHLPQNKTVELVDELADRGMERALRLLLVRTARLDKSQSSIDIAWRIRDVAIDIGGRDLAEEAQHLIALRRPNDPNEWKILGEIRAWQGNTEGAALAYDRGLTLTPDNRDMAALRALVAAGNPVRLDRGFSTSEGRSRIRHALLKAYRAAA